MKMDKGYHSIQSDIDKIDRILSKLQGKLKCARCAFEKAADVTLGTTPYTILYEEDRIKLKHYTPIVTTDRKNKTILLIVYALVNRETMLDLQPNNSVVRKLLENGIDVYMIDWGYPMYNDKYLTIGDHILGYLNSVVEFVLNRCEIDRLNLMGICMGGTFSLMYAALFPEKISNLILTVTPINFNNNGLLNKWIEGLDIDKLVDTFGNISGDMLNLIFLMLNPVRLMMHKYIIFIENYANTKFVKNFIRMEKWIFDSPDVPGETFRQFVKECYQQNLLIKNKMEIDGYAVNLQNVSMPILNIFARYDHLVPMDSCIIPAGRVGSNDIENLCLDTGHIGIYVSRKSQDVFAPKIVEWLGRKEDF